MKLEEIEGSLPNGFHDALLQGVKIDYVKREAIFDFSVWVGDITSKDEKLREAHRKGRLRLSNLLFCIIEAPDPKYPFSNLPHLMINAGPARDLKASQQLPHPVPEEAFVHWFFVNEWNSFIHVAATDAAFEWV
jgi:hypothetical protein